MSYELLTNTAYRIPVGPLVDPSDGKTAEVALDVTALSVQIYQMKNDGSAVVRAQFAPTASGGNNDMILVPSSTDGMYDLEITAAQINWLGNGRISFYDVDGFLVHYFDIHVVSANYFNNKYGSTIEQVNLADNAITAAKYDESTAFPLAKADSGNDEVARTGADSDTLETLSDEIATRAPSGEYDTEMARITGNVALASGVDLTHIMGTILTEGGAGRLAAAFIKLLDVVAPLLVASDVMRGTDGANTTVPDAAGVAPTAVENRQEMDANSTRLAAIETDTTGINGDAMRGTNGANTTVPDPAGTGAALAALIAVAQADLDTITGSDGVTLATLQALYAPSKAGDLMGLIADAITAAKYDESTAFPVKSDDSGATRIARTGADSDTLETLSDQSDLIQAKTDNLPSGIAKNVALSDFEFLMVLSSDHVTGATGLTVTAQISKDGGAFANAANSATEVSGGVYKIDWTQAEINVDTATFKFTATGADQRTITIFTS
ncbi:hypothetical protein KAR91_55400 [Candidatus Pacearchaeota archaeon]|nr:hypothetical protein [Candidatus Pacearchaeota archaeon]